MIAHASRVMRLGVSITALVLILGLTGVAAAGVARHALVTEVHVTFTNTRLLVSPANLLPGPATIFVVNKSKKLHVLTIKGPGLSGVRTEKVAPDSSARLAMKLLTGAYMLSDRVGLGKSNVRWLVVHPSNLVPNRNPITAPKHTPTNAIVPGGMDCDL